MQRLKQAGWIFVCSILAVSTQAAQTVEKPAVLPQAMVSVTVPDLHGFVDGIGGVMAKASPMMNGAFIKNMLGMQLGDPGLSGIAPGKGLAIVALDMTNVFAVVEVKETRIGVYTNAVASKGAQCSFKNGLLVIADTEEQVAKGSKMADAVKTTLLSGRRPALRVAVQPSALIERHKERIDGLLQMMPALMGQSLMQQPGATLDSTQATLRMLEAELHLFRSVASQCDAVETVLAPEDGSLRISKTLVPKEGSRLETLLNAPAVSKPHPNIRAGYLGPAAVSFDSSVSNPQAVMDFMIAEAEQLGEEMKLVDVDLPEMIRKAGKFWMTTGGSLSETVAFSKSGLDIGYLMDVRDEAEALAVIKAMPEDMAPFMKWYESLGMSMEMEFMENVRAHGETKIHQLRMKMELKNQSPEVTQQLASMNLTNIVYDIAVVDNVMILAMGGVKAEAVIDRLSDETFKPAPIKARQVYPDGGFYYFDFDLAEYLSFLAALMPETGNPMVSQQMMDLLKGAEPVTSAGFKEDGRVMFSVNIPGDLIGKFGQIGMMMQMQKMQQQQMNAPQAVPGAMPPPASAPQSAP